jgi:serine/threonine protein kinase
MISGVPPVENATRNDKRFRIISSGRLEQMVTAWGLREAFSDDAMDLVNKLLSPNADTRMTIGDVLSHKALASFSPIDIVSTCTPQPATPRPTLRIPMLRTRAAEPQRPLLMNQLKVVTNTITKDTKQRQKRNASTAMEDRVLTRAQARSRAA